MEEVWKDIDGYEGVYQVSNLGKVKSLQRKFNLGYSIIIKKEQILKPVLRNNGYYFVSLSKSSKRKDFPIHKLVATAYVENSCGGNVVNHKDENKLNNNSTNLEWCTQKQNCNCGTRNARISEKLKKPVLQFDKNHNLIKKWGSALDAEKELGISRTHIGSCANGNRCTAGGFIWEHEKGREETIIEIKEL